VVQNLLSRHTQWDTQPTWSTGRWTCFCSIIHAIFSVIAAFSTVRRIGLFVVEFALTSRTDQRHKLHNDGVPRNGCSDFRFRCFLRYRRRNTWRRRLLCWMSNRWRRWWSYDAIWWDVIYGYVTFTCTYLDSKHPGSGHAALIQPAKFKLFRIII